MEFVENEKMAEGPGGEREFDYCWRREMKEVKKFIPKYIRRAIKDKHGIVDGGSFFVHLFELRLFLQTMPEEVVFLALKAENKFSRESKYLLVKFILAILGKYLVTPAQVPPGQSLSALTLNDCVRSGRRAFVFFKPNLLLEDEARVGFAEYQHEEMHIMESILGRTFFPVDSCFGQVEEVEKELSYDQSGEAPAKQTESRSSPSRRLIRRMIKDNSEVAMRLMEFVDRVIVASEKQHWTRAKSLREWGIWENKRELFSKFHNTEDVNELMVQTQVQIDQDNPRHRERFLVNNLTLTLSKKKKQFLKNMMHLSLPTLRNLFANLVGKAQLHVFIFKLLCEQRKWRKVVNVFKFDFVSKIKVITKLLVFANSTQKIQIVHFFAYDKCRRNFVRIPLEASDRLFPNGMLFVPDLEKFLSERKKALARESKEKVRFKKRVVVFFKVAGRFYMKYYNDQASLLVRHHARPGARQTQFNPLRYSAEIGEVHFEVNEKDQLLDSARPKQGSAKGRPSNLFGDDWQAGRGLFHAIKEEGHDARTRPSGHSKPGKGFQADALEGGRAREQQFSRRW